VTTRLALLRREGRASDGRAFLIRPTSADDAAHLVALRDGVAAEGGLIAGLPGERSAMEEELVRETLLREGGLALTLDVEAAVAGQLLVSRRQQPGQRHIGDVAIVVTNTCRGIGLGHALMEAAIDWARAVGLERLALGVFTTNERAIALYRSVGFVDEEVRPHQALLADGPRDVLLMGMRL